MLKRIECMFFTAEEEVKGKIFNCAMVTGKGSISFGFDELKIQFLIDQSSLEEILKGRLKREVDCTWMKFDTDGLLPIKCKMRIDCETGATFFNLSGTRYFFGIKKGLLQEYLEIKEETSLYAYN